jgi:hypothetical protein
VDVFSLAQLMFFVITGRDPSGENFAKNLEILTHDLGSWIDDRAAKALIDLYRSSTSKQPSERPQTVVDFVSELRRAESVIQVASGTDKITEEDLCRRIGQLYAGLNNYSATEGECRMNSRSGQVEIVARIRNINSKGMASLELECAVTDKIPVPSLKSGRSARDSINMRLDRVVAKLPGVQRHAGNKGAYQVYFNVNDVTLDVGGVNRVADILAKVVAGIEQW